MTSRFASIMDTLLYSLSASVLVGGTVLAASHVIPDDTLTALSGENNGTDITQGLFSFGQPEVVNQGDRIYSDISNEPFNKNKLACTVGYIEPNHKSFLTAGHCGFDNGAVYNAVGQRIGTIQQLGNDRARVIAQDRITFGENNVSGNDNFVVPIGELIGQGVCTQGATTHNTRCGVIEDVDPSTGRINLSNTLMGERGDSGGPIWSDGDFIGTYSGITTQDGNGVGAYGYVSDESSL